ncbi:MAG: alpha/beta hydrolase [Bacillota bacterium]
MKRLIRYILSFLTLITAIGIYFTNRIMFIKQKQEEEILKRDEEAGFLKPTEFEALPKRDVIIPSPFGYSLKAIIVEPWQTNRYMIFCHGVTENKMSSVKYMNLFIERGFNAIIYDQRRHGDSGGKTTSYGFYEKFDLKAVVDWLRKDKDANLFLGIHGESMGAATVLQYAGMLEDSADFYVADCAYSNFEEQLAYRVKEEVKLPPQLMLPIARLFLKIRDRYPLKEVSPISAVEQIEKPILFIHSKKDDYILPDMTERLFMRKKGPKHLFLAENGVHARSLTENREEYAQVLDDFLQNLVYKDNH